MRKWLLTMSPIIVLLIITACSNNGPEEVDNDSKDIIMTDDEIVEEDAVVLKINDSNIYGNTYNQMYLQIKKLMFATDDGETVNNDEIRVLTLDAIMDRELLIQLAEQEGISISEEQIIDKLVEMEKVNIIDYEKMREQFNQNDDAIEGQLRFELARRQYIKNYIEVDVTDSEVKKVYAELQDEIEGIQELEAIEDDLKEMIKLQKTDEKVSDIILEFKKKSEVEVEI